MSGKLDFVREVRNLLLILLIIVGLDTDGHLGIADRSLLVLLLVVLRISLDDRLLGSTLLLGRSLCSSDTSVSLEVLISRL